MLNFVLIDLPYSVSNTNSRHNIFESRKRSSCCCCCCSYKVFRHDNDDVVSTRKRETLIPQNLRHPWPINLTLQTINWANWAVRDIHWAERGNLDVASLEPLIRCAKFHFRLFLVLDSRKCTGENSKADFQNSYVRRVLYKEVPVGSQFHRLVFRSQVSPNTLICTDLQMLNCQLKLHTWLNFEQ